MEQFLRQYPIEAQKKVFTRKWNGFPVRIPLKTKKKGLHAKLERFMQCWAPPIHTPFRNRKNQWVVRNRKFVVIFCTSATANDFLLPQTLLLFFRGLINTENL